MPNPTVTIDLLGNTAPLNQSLGRARDALGRFVKQGTAGSRGGGGVATPKVFGGGSGGGGGGGGRGAATPKVFGGGGGGGGGRGGGGDDDGGMNLGGLIAKVGVATAAMYGLKQAVDFVGSGIALNAQMEDAKTSIATMLGMFGDDRGFGERLKVADGIVEEIREKGIAAEATFSDLLGTFGAIAGTAISAGVSDASKQIDLMVAGSQALKVLNGDQENLAAELNRALSGQLKTGDKLLLVNGMTTEGMKKAVKEGKAFEFIMEKLKPVIGDGAEGMTNWASQVTLLQENWQTFSAAVAAPIFESAKGALVWLNNKLTTITKDVTMWAGTIKNIFANGDAGEVLSLALKIGAAEGINYLVGLLTTFLSALGETFLLQLVRLGDAEFWMAMGDILVGIANIFLGTIGTVGAYLMDGFAGAVDVLAAGLMVAVGKFKSLLMGEEGGGVLTFAEAFHTAIVSPLATLGEGLMAAATTFAIAMKAAMKGDFAPIAEIGLNLVKVLNPASFLIAKTAEKIATVASKAKAGITVDEALTQSKGTGQKVLTEMGIDTEKMKNISGIIASSGVKQAAEGAKARVAQIREDVVNPFINAFKNFKPANVIDVSKEKAELQAKIDAAKPKDGEKEPAPPRKPMTKDKEKDEKFNDKVVADSLQSIGGGGRSVGGGSGLSDAQDQTASTSANTTATENNSAGMTAYSESMNVANATLEVNNTELKAQTVAADANSTTVGEQTTTVAAQTVAVEAQTVALNEQSSHSGKMFDVMKDSYEALREIATNTRNRGGSSSFTLTATN